MINYIIYVDDVEIGKIKADSDSESVFINRIKDWLKEEGQFINHDESSAAFFKKVEKIIRGDALYKLESICANFYMIQY